MKLAELNPHLTQSPGGLHSLAFDCPKCGPPYRVSIACRLNGPTSPGVWTWLAESDNTISVSPSIDNRHHGRKKTCTFHGTITRGEVIFA